MSRRATPALVVVAALSLALVDCGGNASQPPDDASAGADGQIGALELKYSCGTFPFGVDILRRGPGTAELDLNPSAAALRAHLALQEPDVDFLPDRGWILAGMDATNAEYVALAGDLGFISVGLMNGPDGWHVTGWGDCSPQIVLPPALGPAEWVLEGGIRPNPAPQKFVALVTERSCASGQSSEGRVVGPEIVRTPEAVLVVFAVRHPPGGFTQTCPGNPATRTPVDLGAPLGNLTLLDGGSLPFKDPTKPPF